LDHGAKLDEQAISSLLYAAVTDGNLMALMLEYTSSEEISGELGESLLEEAAVQDQREVVELLESCGAPVSIFAACALGRTERVAELLTQNPDLLKESREDEPYEMLEIAASRGYVELVKVLLDRGATLDESLALDGATLNGHIAVVELLIARGADVNSRNDDELTPLQVAVSNGNLEIAKVLIAHHADSKLVDEERNTILHLAAMSNSSDIVRYLVKDGLDVNVRNRRGETPLHQAAMLGKARMAALLIKLGADVNARDCCGATPLVVAEGAAFDSSSSYQEEDPVEPTKVVQQAYDATDADADHRNLMVKLLSNHGGHR
jgi:ankyrin repeat protein